MFRPVRLRLFFVGLSLAGCFSLEGLAEDSEVSALSEATSVAIDVAINPQGLLIGRVVNGEGKPLESAPVYLHSPQGTMTRVHTDAQGAFAYRGLRGGVYYLQSGDSVRLCRVWTSESAPPKAVRGVMLIVEDSVIRGQHGPPPHANGFVKHMKKTLTNPLAVAGITAAAVAIPVAIHNANQDNSPSSP